MDILDETILQMYDTAIAQEERKAYLFELFNSASLSKSASDLAILKKRRQQYLDYLLTAND